ncbi:MAG TPA: HepT-like ribonuclease domain-containing protein [Roseiarcus sp.]|nr:HepT-like ribonuclease domain-containing protein [Roseiarcus sp.]
MAAGAARATRGRATRGEAEAGRARRAAVAGGVVDRRNAQIVGMRNRLVHAYFDINTNVVWKAVTEELPALMPRLRAALVEDGSPH